MPIYFPEERERELPPPGAHLAVCYRVVDLGTQPAGQFPSKRQILFSWELPNEPMADGRPFSISRRYNYSSDTKASLRADVEGWLGRVLSTNDFGKLDLTERLGSTCMLGIKHESKDGRTYANIASVMHPGKTAPARLSPVNPVIAFSLDDRLFDQAGYDSLPDWIKDAIARSPEYRAITTPQSRVPTATADRLRAMLQEPPAGQQGGAESTAEVLDNDIPF